MIDRGAQIFLPAPHGDKPRPERSRVLRAIAVAEGEQRQRLLAGSKHAVVVAIRNTLPAAALPVLHECEFTRRRIWAAAPGRGEEPPQDEINPLRAAALSARSGRPAMPQTRLALTR